MQADRHGSEGHSSDGHGHSHGLVDPTIKRSRAGIRAVLISLLVLALSAAAQTVIFFMTSSVALLADLIHNFGDAATALPVGVAFALRSAGGEVGGSRRRLRDLHERGRRRL